MFICIYIFGSYSFGVTWWDLVEIFRLPTDLRNGIILIVALLLDHPMCEQPSRKCVGFYCLAFFLYKGRTPKGPEAAILFGGNTDYKEDLKKHNYNTTVLCFYKKDPK